MVAAMHILLGPITCGSLATGMSNYADVLGYSWGMSNGGSWAIGGGGGAGKVFVQDFSFTKYSCKGSHAIMAACCAGTHLAEVKFVIRRSGGSVSSPLVNEQIITLSQCVVTSVGLGGSNGDDRLTENISLNFKKFKAEVYVQSESGVATSAGVAEFDVSKIAGG